MGGISVSLKAFIHSTKRGIASLSPYIFYRRQAMCNLVEKARKKIAEDILSRIERGENITIEEFNFIEQYQEMLSLYNEMFSDTLYVLAPIDRR